MKTFLLVVLLVVVLVSACARRHDESTEKQGGSSAEAVPSPPSGGTMAAAPALPVGRWIYEPEEGATQLPKSRLELGPETFVIEMWHPEMESGKAGARFAGTTGGGMPESSRAGARGAGPTGAGPGEIKEALDAAKQSPPTHIAKGRVAIQGNTLRLEISELNGKPPQAATDKQPIIITVQGDGTLKATDGRVFIREEVAKERERKENERKAKEETERKAKDEAVNATLKATIHSADEAEIKASRTLDPTPLYKYFTGEELKNLKDSVEAMKSRGEYSEKRLLDQDYIYFEVNADGSSAEVRVVETWLTTYYSLDSKECKGIIPSRQIPQVIRINRKGQIWLIDEIKFDAQPAPSRVPCKR